MYNKYKKYKYKYLNLKGGAQQTDPEYVEIKNPYIKICETAKFYISSSFSEKLKNLLETCNVEMDKNISQCVKIIDILNKLVLESPIYIAGGVVRDIMHNIQVKDIDIKFKFSNKEQISLLCDKLGLLCPNVWEDIKTNLVYVKFGNDTETLDGLEGQTIKEISIDHLENDVNGLMYDIVNKVIIDPTGTGVTNNLKFRFRICQASFDQWSINTQNKGPVRFFKMLQKNYTVVDDQRDALKFWLENNFTIFDRPVYPDTICSVLVWVLCKTIRGDTLDYGTGRLTKRGKNIQKFNDLLYKMKEFSEPFYLQCVNHLKQYDSDIIY